MKLHEAILGTIKILATVGAVGLAYYELGGTTAAVLWLTIVAVAK